MSAASMVGGLTGAAAVIGVHELARRQRDDAPRVETLGKRGIEQAMRALGRKPPKDPDLYRMSLASALLSDGLYYSTVGTSLPRALGMGAAAGVGTWLLPPLLGLGSRETQRTPQTGAMTVAWYTLGGLAAWAATKAVSALTDDGTTEDDAREGKSSMMGTHA